MTLILTLKIRPRIVARLNDQTKDKMERKIEIKIEKITKIKKKATRNNQRILKIRKM
jgi:hypothetical protein